MFRRWLAGYGSSRITMYACRADTRCFARMPCSVPFLQGGQPKASEKVLVQLKEKHALVLIRDHQIHPDLFLSQREHALLF